MKRRAFLGRMAVLACGAAAPSAVGAAPCEGNEIASAGTGDLGIVVERANGAILIVNTSRRNVQSKVEELGDLSHASAVFSRDQRFAYVFGRDGGVSKVDLVLGRIERRIVQAGNSIGGAISSDGTILAVANYEPGGVRLFDTETLAPLAEIPAEYAPGTSSKTVGIADVPGRRFVFSLYDAGQIWVADCVNPKAPVVRRLENVGSLPYDGLVTPNGRHYFAGLFGEDGLAHVDLWATDLQSRKILVGYGKGETKLPVYKMPHLRGWALAGERLLLPAIGRHEVLIADSRSFEEVGRIGVHGQPVFIVARPDGRHAWVNFAHPRNDTVQVIDTLTQRVIHEMRPGPAVLHMEFTPRGHEVWISVRDADRVDVYDTQTFAKVAELPARKPSGILFSARAQRIGM